MQNSKHGIPFALHSPSGRIVTPVEVESGLGCECVCAGCGAKLMAKKGGVRAWHFAHYEDTDCRNATETAIHRMAKQLIAERSCILLPLRSLFKTIYGDQKVWTENISVEVQAHGLHSLTECRMEETIRRHGGEEGYRRPDILALLDGVPLAIEIKNTHAVDSEKKEWLKRQGCSVLEIDVSDLADLPPEQLLVKLESRLFEKSDRSQWLVHAGDLEAERALEEMEKEVRQRWQEKEKELLAKLEAKEAAKRRKEEYLKQFRDIEDFKIRVDDSTIRVGRKPSCVTLKIHGFVSDYMFEKIKNLARKYQMIFSKKFRGWKLSCRSGAEALFRKLCPELQETCCRQFSGSLHILATEIPNPAPLPAPSRPFPLPAEYDNPYHREKFEERASILEFEANLDRETAEMLAMEMLFPGTSRD